MNRRRPPWLSMTLTLTAVIAAAALGNVAESQRIGRRNTDNVSRLSDALKTATEHSLNCLSHAVRPPYWSKAGDTLYFLCPRPLNVLGSRHMADGQGRVVQIPPTDSRRVWLDSLCRGRGQRVADQTTVLVDSDVPPTRLWTLETGALYVDKLMGGLWMRRGNAEPVQVAPLVDRLRIEPDSTSNSGFSLGLSAAWQVTDETALRRSVYRYVSSKENSQG